MESVHISAKVLKKLQKHALKSFPNECVGIFECMFDEKGLEVTEIYECKNIATDKRYGALLTKKDFRFFNKRRISLEKHNIFYGVYHSHPTTGSLELSDQDKHSSKFYKMFNMQLILGIKNKTVRNMFWYKKSRSWCSAKLIKTGHARS